MKSKLRYAVVRAMPVVALFGYALFIVQPMRTFFPQKSNALDHAIADRELTLTPLLKAIEDGNATLASLLIKEGADLNNSGFRWSPLNQAINVRNLDIVRLLIDHHVDVNQRDQLGRVPLHHAASAGFVGAVELLLAAGAEADIKDTRGITPLHIAAGQHGILWSPENNYCKIVEMLIKAGVSPDSSDDAQRSPLHYAALFGHSDIVNLLLRSGAHLTNVDCFNATPLHYAAGKEGMFWEDRGHYFKIICDLLACGARVNAVDNEGKTPLHYAAACGNEKIVMFLVGHDAIVDVQDNLQATPLHYACGKDSFRFMPNKYAEHVLSTGQIKAHEKRYKKDEAIHSLIVAFLMQKGALPWVKDDEDFMPVQYAFKHKHKKIQKQFRSFLNEGSFKVLTQN